LIFQSRRALTTKDFEILKLIGRGTFGRVFQVRKRDTKRIYAMKVLSKREIIAKKEVAHTIGERDILQCSLESPFLVGLKFSFQTEGDLFLVTDFKSGGELFWHLQRETKFTEERARFYVAELVLALEHLHKYNIVYRWVRFLGAITVLMLIILLSDLKPENILLDATGHVALCDFGLSKANLQQGQLTQTFCGTTEYLAPEVLLDEHGYSKLVDFWSLGVLLFEMCCGWSPFYAEDTQQMYKNICFGRIRFPRGAIGDDGKQFVKALLNRNPKHRLGATRDAAELKEHPFFAGIDWTALAQRRVEPPFKPTVESDESVECFDTEFTSADVAAFGLDSDHESLDEDDPSEAWTAPTVPMGSHTPNGPLGSDAPYSASSVNGSGFFSPPISRTNTVPTPLSAVIPVAATNSLQGPLSGNSSTTAAATAGLPASHAVAIGAPKRKKEKAAAAGGSPIPGSMFQGFTFSGGESVVVPSDLAARAEAAAAADDDLIVKGPALADEEGANTEDEVDDDSRAAGRYARAAKLDDELEF
jgi:serine/threonine protein kinase